MTVFTAVCLIVPSNLSFGYWTRRALRPDVSHSGGAGYVKSVDNIKQEDGMFMGCLHMGEERTR